MYVIYALVDPRDNQVRYIGLTDDVYDRFRQHAYAKGENGMKGAWIEELRTANIMVLFQELQRVETLEEGKKREAYWIQHYHQLGAHLTNKIIPLEQEIVYVRIEETKKEVRLGTRMTVDEQRTYVTRLWSEGLPKKIIYDMVGKYIPREFVSIIIAACEHQSVSSENLPSSQYSGSLTAREKLIGELFFDKRINIAAIVREVYPDVRGGDAYQKASAEVADAIRAYSERQLSDKVRD